MKGRTLLAGAVVALLVVAAVAREARAAGIGKAECIDANTQGQTLRRQGKLAAARVQLQRCADPACPGIVRDDCTQRLDELEHAQPTVVFDIKDGAGNDLVGVTVAVDGHPLAAAVAGTAVRVDPGAHSFVFTAPGQAPVTRTFVIAEGEKDQHENVVIGAPPAPAPAKAGAATPSTSPSTAPGSVSGSSPATVSPADQPTASHRGMPTQKVIGLALGGVGVAGLAAGAVFGMMTLSAASQQKTDCASATSCTNYSRAATDHSNGQTDGLISTIGFAAGGALLVGGAVLFFTARHDSEVPASTALVVVPQVSPTGGGISLQGEL